MQMEMENRLARVRAHVVHRAKSVLQLALLGDLRRDQVRVADNLVICFRQMVYASDMFFGDNQDVGRRAGLDVFKGEDLLVFVHLL